MSSRLIIIVPGLLVTLALAFIAAFFMLPSGHSDSEKLEAWAMIAGGPLQDLAWRRSQYFPSILLGWLGLPMIFAHMIRPMPWTALVTVVGYLFWLWAGFLTVMSAGWGG